MILLKQALLLLAGVCAGGIIASGVYAFLAIIGVFVRLMGKTGTRCHILLYETWIMVGGILGNILDIYEFPIHMGAWTGQIFMAVFGGATGIFVGCLAMSLAETLKALPVISRRIHLSVGLPWLIAATAAGKLIGSLIYFFYRLGTS
ncbi:MAG: stage V sporulation protein AB [Clostridiales bacterium]|nr:stage V sporulation protein AB [Clostridiales bacterium]